MPYEDVNEMLAASGAPAAKFVEHGDEHEGRLVHAETRQSTEFGTDVPLFWADGKPRMEVVVTIDTGQPDNNGVTERRLFCKGDMLRALREAVKASGSKLENGGRLKMRYVNDGEQKTKGYNPPKLFKAKWTPPAAAAVDLDDL